MDLSFPFEPYLLLLLAPNLNAQVLLVLSGEWTRGSPTETSGMGPHFPLSSSPESQTLGYW